MAYENWKKGDPIVYKKAQAEPFAYVPPKGAYRETLVPDTVDLSEMARLSVHAMTEATDPDADYEIYFWMLLHGKTPMMRHDMADMCIMKFQEGLPLLRQICGSRENEHVERAWMENTLKSIGEDGHLYECLEGRPWWRDLGDIPAAADGKMQEGLFSIDPAYSGRFLSAMVLYHMRSGDEIWKTTALRLVDALANCAVDKGHYAYFSPSPYLHREGSTEDHGRDEPLVGIEARHPLLGCLHVYRAFGYEPALQLARKLLVYIMDELGVIAPDGEYTAHANFVKESRCFEFMGTEAHFHGHTTMLHCALEYTLLSGDQTYLDRVLKGYDYGKTHGQALLGFFGEYAKSVEYEQHEACQLADLIAVAVKLSEAGIRDCYNDIDLWLRNMGSEGQLTPDKAVALQKYAESLPYESEVFPNYGYDRAVERNIGAYAGWAMPNQFFDPIEHHVIMHCCTGNMARALYYAWKSAVRFEGETLNVNLLMNLETPLAEVVSFIPYHGRVEIRPKKDCAAMKLRLPDWADAETARITINGRVLSASADGAHLMLPGVKSGDEVVLELAVPEMSKYIWVEKQRYYLTMRGNDAVDILPKGVVCPLFNRGRYTTGEVTYKKVARFVTDEEIDW